MPWSPIGKFGAVIKGLKGRGYSQEVPISELRKQLTFETGIISKKTLGRYIEVMAELGYIELKSPYVAVILSEKPLL